MLKLKEIRENRGLTQEQIGKIINVTRSQVSKYESGSRMLNQQQIIDLVKALNTTADYFLGLSQNEKKER